MCRRALETGMEYWLRRVIFEDIWERQLEELLDTCPRMGVDRVLFMEQSHLLLMAPYPAEKHRRMARIYETMGRRLRQNGIDFGVNIATIVGHTDTEAPADCQNSFQKYVGDSLRPARSACCILDTDWQDYGAEVASIYAGAHPSVIFVDDDFRSLNHGDKLGCFCPLHIKATSHILGRSVTGEEIIAALKADGTSAQKDVVRAWMQVNMEGQRQAAVRIEAAVHRTDPSIRLGLMTADELRHSLSGRELNTLLADFAGRDASKVPRQKLYRPTGAVYGDGARRALFDVHQRMALTMSRISEPSCAVSELEMFPHTRYFGSLAVSRLMLQLHMLAGADHASLNVFDYLGNPLMREDVFVEMLRKEKPHLEKIAALRKGKKARGIGLPYRLDASVYRSYTDGQIASLYPDRTADLLLPAMGLPTQFTEGSVNILTGDAALCYSKMELERLLSGVLLMDGRAAALLAQRGFGPAYTGVHVQGDPLASVPVLEQITNDAYAPDFSGDYMATRWNIRPRRDQVILDKEEDAVEITALLDLDKRRLGSGMTDFSNPLGGHTIVYAVGMSEDTWIYRARAALLHGICRMYGEESIPVSICDYPDLGPFYYEDPKDGSGLVGILNASPDTYDVPPAHIRFSGIYPIRELQSPVRFAPFSLTLLETRRCGM